MAEPIFQLKGILHGKQGDEDFNGPLDLILQMLSDKKILVKDIQITDILDQYLEWMDTMHHMNIEIASEFVAMASYLLYIKSRVLLAASEEEAKDEMDLLIRSLEERQREEMNLQMQACSIWLSENYGVGSLMFTRASLPPMESELTLSYHPQELLKALSRAVEREIDDISVLKPDFNGIVESDPFPVTLKIAQILKRLSSCKRVNLTQLFNDCNGRSELVAVFLSVLELYRLNSISFEYTDDFNPNVVFLRMPNDRLL